MAYYELLPNWILGNCMLALVVSNLYVGLGRRIIVLELTALIAVLQCISGPLLAYSPSYNHYKYGMYVDPITYFTFALPATSLFVAALLWPIRQAEQLTFAMTQRPNLDRAGYGLLALSIGSAFASRLIPGLAFLFYLLSQFKYLGAVCLYFSRSPYKWVAIPVVLLSGYLTAAHSGMFHEMLLWGCFIAGFVFLKLSRSHTFKLAAFSVTIIGVLLIQSIKAEYREQKKNGGDVNLVAISVDAIPNLLNIYQESDFRTAAIARLNQGWIVSAIMAHVPAEEPFAEGETPLTAIKSSILPRFLAPDKEGAGGRDNFTRFTGLHIGDDTSMCIGTLGEAYANFGILGGIATMFLLGVIYNRILALFTSLGRNNAYFLLCIPLIFLQPVKSETELLVVLNHFTKSIMVVFISYFWLHEFFLPGNSDARNRTRPAIKSAPSAQPRHVAL
jgi:hypothetical protein